MGIVASGHCLHLACDAAGCPRVCAEFAGPTKAAAYAEAREKGWEIQRNGKCWCKNHKKDKR